MTEERIATIDRSALGQTHILVSAVVAAAMLLLSVDLAFAQDTSFGQRLFQDKADCQFCHGINGDGRGDPRSPGRAADLHETHLNRDQLIEVITCGRPGTEMPHFDKYAYEDTDCYGLKGKNLGNDTVRDPHSLDETRNRGSHRLRPRKICQEIILACGANVAVGKELKYDVRVRTNAVS